MKTRIILLVTALAATLVVACSGSSNNPTNPDSGVDSGFQCVTDGSDPKNACTDNTCYPFPITQARLPLLNADGSVPPLN